ncbi:MAG TPA: sortase [Candidatus Dormibacteraeota bacterium]|nr:sortase [Candidatus Dormibacteraeota bacterium]
MTAAASLVARLVSALITAAGVVLLTAGLLVLSVPAAGGAAPSASPTDGALASPTATPEGGSSSPTATRPAPSPGAARPTRIVIAGLHIDLPIVPTQTKYPLCDVAQYLVEPAYKMSFPGVDGLTTYIYAHARQGMFLPLLTASTVNNGDALKGQPVLVYTDDDKVYSYVIDTVRRHSTDFDLASSVDPDQQRLVLQTSEGPAGTIPKLQVAATMLSVAPASHADAHPAARPRVCS